MLDKYQPRFSDLTSDQVDLLARALNLAPTPSTGDDLYEACRSAGHSQATVVLALSGDPSVRACRTIETLIGRPIERGHPCLSGPAPSDGRTRRVSSPRPARPTPPRHDPRVIVHVTPNPKRAGSAPAARYENYRVGMTINEAISAGVTPADVRWDEDPRRGFISAALPDDPDAIEARRVYLERRDAEDE